VDSLHVEIDNLNDPLVGFCFIRSIDKLYFIFLTDALINYLFSMSLCDRINHNHK
jgi:hypothetical protein